MDDSVRAEYQRRLAQGDRAGALSYLQMLRTQTNDPAERQAYNQAIAEIEGRSVADESNYGQSAGPFGDQPAAWAAEHTPPATISVPPGNAGSSAGAAEGPGPGISWSDTPAAAAPSSPAPSYGGGPSYPGTSAGVGSGPVGQEPPSYGGSPSYPGTSAGVGSGPVGQGGQQPAAGGVGGALAGAGEFIGGRIQHAFENVTGGPHTHPSGGEPPAQNPAQNPAEAIGGRIQHAFENVTGGPHHPQEAQGAVKGEKTSFEENEGGSSSV